MPDKPAEQNVLFSVVVEFLIPGQREPYELAEGGAEAIGHGVTLAQSFKTLEPGLKEVLELIYALDARGKCPNAARAVLAALGQIPAVLEALKIPKTANIMVAMADRVRQRAQERDKQAADEESNAIPNDWASQMMHGMTGARLQGSRELMGARAGQYNLAGTTFRRA